MQRRQELLKKGQLSACNNWAFYSGGQTPFSHLSMENRSPYDSLPADWSGPDTTLSPVTVLYRQTDVETGLDNHGLPHFGKVERSGDGMAEQVRQEKKNKINKLELFSSSQMLLALMCSRGATRPLLTAFLSGEGNVFIRANLHSETDF